MKRFSKSIHGVTLLEIMLVLAVAAMILVMSVRYYQSAVTSQQVNSAYQQIQGITAAADGLAQASGSYSPVNTTSVGSIMPGGPTQGMTTPWGTQITIGGSPTANTYTVTIANTPARVCPLLRSKLIQDAHYTPPASCGPTTANFTYTYTANP